VVVKRANELLKAQANAKGGRVVAEIVSEGLPVEVTCRVVGVSVSGLYVVSEPAVGGARQSPAVIFGGTLLVSC